MYVFFSIIFVYQKITRLLKITKNTDTKIKEDLAQVETIVKEVCATIISVHLNTIGEVMVCSQCKCIVIIEESFFLRRERENKFCN